MKVISINQNRYSILKGMHSSRTKDEKLSLINEGNIRPVDVLCGRGPVSFNHVGNATYRMLISQSIDSYLAATNTFQKALVVRKAAAGILSIGGRFLKKSRNKDGWVEMPEKEYLEKVAQAIRDAAKHADRQKCLPKNIGSATESSPHEPTQGLLSTGNQTSNHDSRHPFGPADGQVMIAITHPSQVTSEDKIFASEELSAIDPSRNCQDFVSNTDNRFDESVVRHDAHGHASTKPVLQKEFRNQGKLKRNATYPQGSAASYPHHDPTNVASCSMSQRNFTKDSGMMENGKSGNYRERSFDSNDYEPLTRLDPSDPECIILSEFNESWLSKSTEYLCESTKPPSSDKCDANNNQFEMDYFTSEHTDAMLTEESHPDQSILGKESECQRDGVLLYDPLPDSIAVRFGPHEQEEEENDIDNNWNTYSSHGDFSKK